MVVTVKKEICLMSIKTQKIIMFIPFVNIACFVCWLSSVFKYKVPYLDAFKTALKIFGFLFAISIIITCIYFINDSEVLYVVTSIFTFLLIPFVVAFISVKAQEKYENNK